MTRSFKRISLVVAGTVAIMATAAMYGLAHGYFDHGQFRVMQFEWSSTYRVAMLARRSDRQALGGLEYFVLIGDHVFTPAELRHAYYSDAVVFNAASDCLTLHWDEPKRLAIRCSGSTIAKNDINVQRRQVGEVDVSYENIARK
jgi:hypothetical protein